MCVCVCVCVCVATWAQVGHFFFCLVFRALIVMDKSTDSEG